MQLVTDPWLGQSVTDLARDADTAARERVAALLRWASGELDLLSDACEPADGEDRAAVAARAGLAELPASYDAFLSLAGGDGPGTILGALFPGDEVAAGSEALEPALASAALAGRGHPMAFRPGQLVICARSSGAVEWIDVTAGPAQDPDPPVFRLGDDTPAVTVVAAHVTDWLEWAVRRSIKRRYPLRDAIFPSGPAAVAAAPLPQRRRG